MGVSVSVCVCSVWCTLYVRLSEFYVLTIRKTFFSVRSALRVSFIDIRVYRTHGMHESRMHRAQRCQLYIYTSEPNFHIFFSRAVVVVVHAERIITYIILLNKIGYGTVCYFSSVFPSSIVFNSDFLFLLLSL